MTPSRTLVLVGALLIGVSVAGFAITAGGDRATGEVPAPVTADAPVSAPVAPPTTPPPPAASPSPTARAAEPAPAPPIAIQVPAIGVDASTVRVGLEPDGSMEIPEDVATVGWYELGVAPGEAGSAVLAGHVDSRSQGRGAFFDLRELDVDDRANVVHADGETNSWQVVGRATYPKSDAPLAELFRRGGSTQLVLITCGGDFDAGARSYRDNVVVILEPV